MASLIGALDQGTTSTRFIVFDHAGAPVASHQLEHRQILPRPGWVEHDPLEILQRTRDVMAGALRAGGLSGRDLAAIGITNQRETVVAWNPKTGEPWGPAIVWQDTRTDRACRALEPRAAWLRARTGLPPATYFSASKLQWMLDGIDGLRAAVSRGEAVAGTIDSWLVWNLTGGPAGGRHATDVTNASRTQLMNLQTLAWDNELLDLFGVPREMLPAIQSSIEPSAYGTTPLAGADVPIAGILGDQQAALMGQACYGPGDAKNTYGTGNFLLLNTGPAIVPSTCGLLTTVAWGLTPTTGGLTPITYALEGSIAVTGSAVQWLRDQMGLIASAAEIEPLAASVPDSGGVYFVPAFSGLFAPYWRADARGAIVGLTRFNTKAHLARATLEAIGFQTRAVLDAMTADAHIGLGALKVDGGATVNDTLMQLQADILGVSVVRPVVKETTALGAAYAAGLAVGFWKGLDVLRGQWKAERQWDPVWSADRRETAYNGWQRAVERSVGWA